MKKKLILVTGGAGFIGSVLVRHLNDLGFSRLIIVDNLGTSDKWKNLRGKSFLDIIHKNELWEQLEKWGDDEIDAIFHLGACTSTTESDCNYLLENNYRYSVRLASYATARDIRFIYASSAATYGDGTLGFDDNTEHLERLVPLNMYGYSKHLFDLWLKRENLLNRVVGLKYFNVFGPNEYHKGQMASAIVKMVREAKEQKTISLFKSNDPRFGDGDQVRDFIYVKDVAKMTAAFLENRLNGIFNVGTGSAQTWNQLAKAVAIALNKDIKIDYVNMPKILLDKYQNYTKADMAHWEKVGLPLPSFSLEASVSDYVKNYLISGGYC